MKERLIDSLFHRLIGEEKIKSDGKKGGETVKKRERGRQLYLELDALSQNNRNICQVA